MTQDLPGALRARDRMLAIAADPDLGQTAKLFAFCLLAYLVSPARAEKKGKSWAEVVGDMMIAESSSIWYGGNRAVEWVRHLIANDIPCYRVEIERPVRCRVIKTRGKNAGQPCGRPAQWTWVEHDPQTGEAERIGHCSNHSAHFSELQLRRRERFAQWEANGKPVPPANRGGILARHFNANWAKLYAWANPNCEPLPEGKPLTPPQPTLVLIKGGQS